MKSLVAVAACMALGLPAASGLYAAVGKNQQQLTFDISKPTTAMTKVVNLLTDLQKRIKEDQATEQNLYDRYACWVETTTQNYAKSMTALREKIASLGNQILRYDGAVQTATRRLQETADSLTENAEAQASSTATRQRDHARFNAENDELKKAVEAIEKANTMLTAGSGAFLQESAKAQTAAALAGATAAIEHLPEKLIKKPQQLSALGKAAYAPQADTIIGILQQMLKTFKETKEELVGAETSAATAYENQMATLKQAQKELEELQAQLKTDKAEAETKLSHAEQDYDDSTQQLAADTKFFETTRDAGIAKHGVWTERKGLREEELHGIEHALAILTDEESRDLFVKTLGFLQVDSSAPVVKAAEMLRKTAVAAHSLRLAKLSASVRASAAHAVAGKDGPFTKVLLEIEKLVGELKQEQKDEDKAASTCIDNTHNYNMANDKFAWNIKKGNAKIAQIEKDITEKQALVVAKTEKKEEDEQRLIAIKKQRQEEEAKYIADTKDMTDAIALIGQAMVFLKAFYEKHGAPSMLQSDAITTTYPHAPEAEFDDKFSRHGESQGIITTLQHLQEHLEGDKASAKTEEDAAIETYNTMKGELDTSVQTLDKAITDLGDQISGLQGERDIAEDGVTSNTNLKNSATETEKAAQEGCGPLLKNLERYREHRTTEIEGLLQAKSFLLGMN